ncbi:MAG: helix-turn-helix domain-containing protein [Dehalococcoidales bacterium]|nr:MAG: helix-turn-helix domain-containing protein [Dehalococcoidales bacterium]
MGEDAARTEMNELTENPDTIQDLLPEHIGYKDEGCDLANSCLNCPYEECVYVKPGGKRHWMKNERSIEMIRLHTEEEKTVKEIANMYGVSKRTVQRALKIARIGIGNNRSNTDE